MKASHLSFLISLFLSKLGDQVLLFLVPLVVYQTTQSISWSGLAFFAETLPRFVAFPVCGALCDRRSPMALLRTSQLYRAVSCAVGIVGYQFVGEIGWLIVLSAVCGVLTTQGMMAREVMLPHIFAGPQFRRGLAYSQTADQAGFVLGPLLAALILGWSHWEVAVAIASGLFVLADISLTVWRRAGDFTLPTPETTRGAWFTPITTAFSHVRNVPGLFRLVVLAAGVNLVLGVTLASAPALVTGLHARSTDYYAGLQALGAIVTVVILLSIAHSRIPLRAMVLISYTSICAGGLITAISPTPWGYAVGFLLVIGFDKMFNIFIRTSRQKIIPVADYGKTTGVLVMLNNLTQPFAGLLVGASSAPQETTWLILLLTVVTAVLGVVAGAGSVASSEVRPSV